MTYGIRFDDLDVVAWTYTWVWYKKNMKGQIEIPIAAIMSKATLVVTVTGIAAQTAKTKLAISLIKAAATLLGTKLELNMKM